MPNTSQRTEPEPPGRRELILEAAIDLFRRHGFNATGIDEIGAGAGITGPGVYRHFASKQEILDLAVARGTEEIFQHSAPVFEEQKPSRETLDLLIIILVNDVLDRPAQVTVLLRERRNLSAKGRRMWDQSVRRFVGQWAQVLVKLTPKTSDAVARTKVWMALGMALAAAQYKSDLDRDQLASVLRGMIIGSLFADPA